MFNVYYYTYGTNDKYPFVGGWTEIVANSHAVANQVFKRIHPNLTNPEYLNCCGVYLHDEIVNTTMFRDGNFGRHAHERIIVNDDGTYYSEYSIII